MCLATPIQIKSIEKTIAVCNHDGKDFEVSLQLIPQAKVGDWIIAHGEMGISILSSSEAEDILKLIKQSQAH